MLEPNPTYLLMKIGNERRVKYHLPEMSAKTINHLNECLATGYMAMSKVHWETMSKRDVVKEYHIKQGCCDGSDPGECYSRRRKVELQTQAELKEAERQRRILESDEYYGTEGTE